MSKRMTPTVGVFAGILSLETGKLLLMRREEAGSIIEESFKRNWELPGGGVEEAEKVPYDWLVKELIREIQEETGLRAPESIYIDQMPAMFPLLFKGNKGFDLSMMVVIETWHGPTKGESIWVSPEELGKLAEDYVSGKESKDRGLKEAKGLLGGFGKRMHCMALKALCFSNKAGFAGTAKRELIKIQDEWE